MKEYSLHGKNKPDYILDVKIDNDGSWKIRFADGSVFRKIYPCSENLEKIIEIQEQQARIAIDNSKFFINKEKSEKRKMILSGVGAGVASAAAVCIPAVQGGFSTQNPLLFVAGVGVITILGMIPSYTKLRKHKDVNEELKKLQYRENHLDILNTFRNYPNSLAGLDDEVARWIMHTDDPFSIIYIDEYDLDDLKQIVSNIGVEKCFDFAYTKRKQNNK